VGACAADNAEIKQPDATMELCIAVNMPTAWNNLGGSGIVHWRVFSAVWRRTCSLSSTGAAAALILQRLWCQIQLASINYLLKVNAIKEGDVLLANKAMLIVSASPSYTCAVV